MHYYLWNMRTKSALWFSSRRDLNKWIRRHYPLMSFRQQCQWSVHRDLGFTADDPVFGAPYCYGNPMIAQLPDYILSHLRID